MVKSKKLIIVGTSAFAELAFEYFTHDSEYEVVAFAVEKSYKISDVKLGLPVVSVEECPQYYAPQDYFFYAAITYKQLNHLRARLFQLMKGYGYGAASYISTKAFVWPNVEIGEHCFIFENNTVQPYVRIGSNVVLWSGNHIGHHSLVNDHCFISSHVVISGFCSVGEYSFLGVNSTIADCVSIGEKNFIGSGGIILADTAVDSVHQTDTTPKHRIPATRLFKVKR